MQVYRVTPKLRVYVQFDQEVHATAASNSRCVQLDQCKSRFIYGLLVYLTNSKEFRRNFLFKLNTNNLKELLIDARFNFEIHLNTESKELSIVFTNAYNYDVIVQSWTSLVLYWANKKKFYDAAWAYLSTLGGAYASLGEEYDTYAKNAEKVSIRQIRLAKDFNDPIALLRCYIYLAFSYTQLKMFKKSRLLLLSQLENIKVLKNYDDRLRNMYIAAFKKNIIDRKLHKYGKL